MHQEKTNLKFGRNTLSVKIAETDSERARGLMEVTSLPDGHGMLFVMNGSPASFWMKNTLIPLDIAFIDGQMRIVKISSMKPHTGRSSCGYPIKYVVETNAGWFGRNGIVIGDSMTLNENEEIKNVVSLVLNEMWERPTCFEDIVYRPFSSMFFQKVREMKERMGSLSEGTSSFDRFTREALSTDIGEFAIFEGISVPLDIPIPDFLHQELYEIKKLPAGAKLGKPQRGGSSKFHVYVRDPKTKNIKKVNFGAKGMSVGIDNPARVKSFVARHNCDKANDKTKASYWSCRLPRYWKSLGMKKTSKKWW